MKKVFSNSSEVIHLWAQQSQSEGTNQSRNVFFNNTKIYSYGHHYLLAEFIDKNTVLINDRGYSVTTSKHISQVSYATNHYKQFYVTTSDLEYIKSHVKNYLLPKLANARKPELYTSEILSLWKSLNEYLEYTKTKRYKSNSSYKFLKTVVNNLNLDSAEFKAKLAKQLKAKVRLEKKQKALELKWALGQFYAYEINNIYARNGFDYLRISQNGENVETSQGVKVTVKDAKILYKMIKNNIDVKGHKIGYYTVNSINGTLKIGCHNIDMDSVHKIGSKLI